MPHKDIQSPPVKTEKERVLGFFFSAYVWHFSVVCNIILSPPEVLFQKAFFFSGCTINPRPIFYGLSITLSRTFKVMCAPFSIFPSSDSKAETRLRKVRLFNRSLTEKKPFLPTKQNYKWQNPEISHKREHFDGGVLRMDRVALWCICTERTKAQKYIYKLQRATAKIL